MFKIAKNMLIYFCEKKNNEFLQGFLDSGFVKTCYWTENKYLFSSELNFGFAISTFLDLFLEDIISFNKFLTPKS